MTFHPKWPNVGAPRPVLFDHEPGQFYLSQYRNLSIMVWVGRADGAAIQRVRVLSHQLIAKYPDGHSNVTIILNGCPPPTEEARVAFNYVFDGRISDLRCMAMVLEGEGFWASALRSMVTGVRNVTANTFTVKLFSELGQASEWLPAEHLAGTGVALTSAELLSALTEARDELAKPR